MLPELLVAAALGLKCHQKPGSDPIPALKRLPHVHFVYLSEPPSFLSKIPFVVSAPFKISLQIATILYALLFQVFDPPEFILVQVGNPMNCI